MVYISTRPHAVSHALGLLSRPGVFDYFYRSLFMLSFSHNLPLETNIS